MNKVLGYIIYGIGIIGGVEGVMKKSIPISIIAIVVLAAGGYLLGREE